MDTFDIVVLLSGTAGLVMVVGGIGLIWKGAMKLAETDSSTALSLEWKKEFRLHTQAPGIAFFIVGLFFSILAVYSSKPSIIEPVWIVGNIDNIDKQATVTIKPSVWTLKSGTGGEIEGQFVPSIESLYLTITVPGYEQYDVPLNLNKARDRVLRFEEPIALKKIIDEIEANPDNIVPLPDNFTDINSENSFGGSQ